MWSLWPPGTLALLRQKGWEVHTASLTPGDCGTMTHSREEISRIRRAEGAAAAGLLGGTYHCLECDDMFILYDRPTLLKVIGLIRHVRPDLVFAPSPEDYMADHENASRLVWNACFAAGIPNIPTPGDEPFHRIPCLYYMDPGRCQGQIRHIRPPPMVWSISPPSSTSRPGCWPATPASATGCWPITASMNTWTR